MIEPMSSGASGCVSPRPDVPTISVIVPFLRAEATIERAVRSALDQDDVQLELVAVNDGSVDGTRAVLERMASHDPRIRLLDFAKNHGPAFARNRAIEIARGKWIAVLDADDAFERSRLRRLLEGADDESVVIVDNLTGVDPFDGSTTGPLFPSLPSSVTFVDLVAARAPGTSYNYGYLKPIFRRSFLARHALRYEESLRTAEDLLLLLECCLVGGRIQCIPQAGYRYTLQSSPKTGRLAATSHSLPVDRQVADALDTLLERHGHAMHSRDRAALHDRQVVLRRNAEVSEFRHAMKTGAYAHALRLAASAPVVRSYVADVVFRRFAGRPP